MRARIWALLAGTAPLFAWLACSSDPGGGAPTVDAGPEGYVDPPPDAGRPEVAAPVPKGARKLGLEINTADDQDYLRVYARAREAGVEITNVTLNWDDIEYPPLADAGSDADAASAPDADSDAEAGAGPEYFNAYLHIANLVFPAYKTQVSLGVRPLDTNGSHAPPDLAQRPWDAPEVLTRFNRLQDYVFQEIPDLSISVYVIGNEIDIPFGSDAAKYAAYKTFYEGAATYARSLRPGLKVGVAATLGGLTGAQKAALQSVNATSDFVVATYYPIAQDFAVRSVSDLRTDLDALVQAYPGKPIYLREAGYPSADTLGSSDALQAEFVREMFSVWDERRDQIPVVTFFTMHEYGQPQLDALASYYGSNDPRFSAFLRTLGLRRSSDGGVDKLAFEVFAREAKARGW